ncbi:MAG: hypothetical protein KGI41_00445 [Patescibacteria group bacterium]|nr:hypothetical protein [Patescibacteria group bacterium]MDE1965698.1 hypothetical protein [Patescibacteria group bacterium]
MRRTHIGGTGNALVEGIGWYGVAATILAYALVSFAWLPPDNLIYQGLNFTGAAGVTLETWVRRDYQPFWLNLIWAGIALLAIGNIIAHLAR